MVVFSPFFLFVPRYLLVFECVFACQMVSVPRSSLLIFQCIVSAKVEKALNSKLRHSRTRFVGGFLRAEGGYRR